MDVSNLQPGHDLMASFDGFLNKRARDRDMQRDTMMSQIDGLVNNLNADIGPIAINKAAEAAMKNKTIEDLKAEADLKENMLLDGIDDTMLDSTVRDDTVRPTEFDDSILQKRPSNSPKA